MANYPKQVTVFEVGPRDGLQNESQPLTLRDKVTLVNALGDAGFKAIEVGSFVSPKWVPKMADSAEVFSQIERKANVRYGALTPNMKGFEAALEAGATEVAIFGAASEAFSQKNINCSIRESLERFEPLMKAASEEGLPVRGYISCVAGCPYQGAVDIQAVAELCRELRAMGCYEISLGDTIGVATPEQTKRIIEACLNHCPVEQLAVHLHDSYGQAIANVYAALQMGVATIDSSIAGLGGCPYAPGASGNVATEDVLYLLQGLGIGTGIDLQAAIAAGNQISQALGRANSSKVAQAASCN